MTNQKTTSFLQEFDKVTENIYTAQGTSGYWSNFSKKENEDFLKLLENHTTREAIMLKKPMISDVIFSEKRPVALELLDLKGNEIAVDLGCMWGAITIPLAKQVGYVLGVDQTIDSLKFTEARVKEEKINNVSLLNANLRDLKLPDSTFDIAIVNGVLEWVPEIEDVELADYWYKKISRKSFGNPKKIQTNFLKNIHNSLKNDGRLLLAIENRYDYKMFFGTKDPHTGMMFTTILPKNIANIISKIFRKREYRPWIYSFSETEKLLKDAGFNNVTLHSCWPDYRFPEYITKYGEVNIHFEPFISRKDGKLNFKRIISNRVEWVLFKLFNVQFFAPSIIAIAQK